MGHPSFDMVLSKEESTLTEVTIGNEIFYKISNVGAMRPFFMTIVSDSNHWLFVSSNGGISAGRKNSEYALFPYYTDDKITVSAEHTGCKTILQVFTNEEKHTWEPFSVRSENLFVCERNLYKNRYGNKIIFEEINSDLGISFQYEWNFSNQYGFVRKATITNHSLSEVTIQLLDGLQNILPYGTGSDLLNTTSNLANAYKRSELLSDTGLGIFALSAIIVDKAEPSEALKANTVWSLGLPNPVYLLSSLQVQQFRKGNDIQEETDIKGEQGAYFVCSEINLAVNQQQEWMIVANVNQTQANILQLAENIKTNKNFIEEIKKNVEEGSKNLLALTAASDGLQYSTDNLGNTRHYANTLFNIMRGGIFDANYTIEKKDFSTYIKKANAIVYASNENTLLALPETFSVFTIKELATQTGDADFIRLATEYLPLKFSRRHGDPSRPWNKFTINTHSEIDGSKILDYEGNWRDIFQNWEALAHSYPAFIEGMIFKFLNASTFDGYNPYRVTKDGFDWETIEPDNPWSYIGYWGDHQIIYLLKFLEFAQQHYPALLTQLLNKEYFVYANVPYIIKPYQQILQNPKDTIDFNHKADSIIRQRIEKIGADGALLTKTNKTIHTINFTEKIIATLLAKLTNLVPDGGIWMNTQRPEWNDANNALVGNGLSMVTLFYLRRFLCFIKPLFDANAEDSISLSEEMHEYCSSVAAIYEKYISHLPARLNNELKKCMLDELGETSSTFREKIYAKDFSGNKLLLSAKSISSFLATALSFIDNSIKANKREDGLYHTYNLLSYNDKQLEISHLSEMLEGQVAVLSSGYLSPHETVTVLDALNDSSLFRKDQDSYILYPNKDLPGFLQKNSLPAADVEAIPSFRQLLDSAIIEKNIKGGYHFNGNFKNANDVDIALQKLDSKYKSAVVKDKLALLQLFEKVFNHKAFTGRSGTFFAYEGLGSIYWHMVSKLLLAVQETYVAATYQQADEAIVKKIATHFHAIKKGIGAHKSPALYGAFPTDPYSHTPMGKGAQQPGMTGQVKEDIISRFGELGVAVNNGQFNFHPTLLRKEEFLENVKNVTIINTQGEAMVMRVPENSILFTLCQIPVVYSCSEEKRLLIKYKDGTMSETAGLTLNREESEMLFNRTGAIENITVYINTAELLV